MYDIPTALKGEHEKPHNDLSAATKLVIALTDRLKAEMPRMLNERKAIVQALDELRRAAEKEGHAEVSRFLNELMAHAHMDEQVFYTAAIRVGEYLKLTSAAR